MKSLLAVAIDLREIVLIIKSKYGCVFLRVPPEDVCFLNLIVEGENDRVEVRLSREDVAFMNSLLMEKKEKENV
ncbi:MAG: hypothetical protein MUP27_08860 [Desulfobacterales bacterium]|nr:hypothetical protein [Desulfobacterales bacterium]